jgi:hypothetical protein
MEDPIGDIQIGQDAVINKYRDIIEKVEEAFNLEKISGALDK